MKHYIPNSGCAFPWDPSREVLEPRGNDAWEYVAATAWLRAIALHHQPVLLAHLLITEPTAARMERATFRHIVALQAAEEVYVKAAPAAGADMAAAWRAVVQPWLEGPPEAVVCAALARAGMRAVATTMPVADLAVFEAAADCGATGKAIDALLTGEGAVPTGAVAALVPPGCASRGAVLAALGGAVGGWYFHQCPRLLSDVCAPNLVAALEASCGDSSAALVDAFVGGLGRSALRLAAAPPPAGDCSLQETGMAVRAHMLAAIKNASGFDDNPQAPRVQFALAGSRSVLRFLVRATLVPMAAPDREGGAGARSDVLLGVLLPTVLQQAAWEWPVAEWEAVLPHSAKASGADVPRAEAATSALMATLAKAICLHRGLTFPRRIVAASPRSSAFGQAAAALAAFDHAAAAAAASHRSLAERLGARDAGGARLLSSATVTQYNTPRGIELPLLSAVHLLADPSSHTAAALSALSRNAAADGLIAAKTHPAVSAAAHHIHVSRVAAEALLLGAVRLTQLCRADEVRSVVFRSGAYAALRVLADGADGAAASASAQAQLGDVYWGTDPHITLAAAAPVATEMPAYAIVAAAVAALFGEAPPPQDALLAEAVLAMERFAFALLLPIARADAAAEDTPGRAVSSPLDVAVWLSCLARLHRTSVPQLLDHPTSGFAARQVVMGASAALCGSRVDKRRRRVERGALGGWLRAAGVVPGTAFGRHWLQSFEGPDLSN